MLPSTTPVNWTCPACHNKMQYGCEVRDHLVNKHKHTLSYATLVIKAVYELKQKKLNSTDSNNHNISSTSGIITTTTITNPANKIIISNSNTSLTTMPVTNVPVVSLAASAPSTPITNNSINKISITSITNTNDALKDETNSIDLNSTVTNSEESNFQQAWEILQNPIKVKDTDSLATYLDELDLTEAMKLSYCETQEILEMSRYLKPIPSKYFLKLMNESNK